MTQSTLLENQTNLQTEAKQVIEQLNLESLLSPLGEVHFVGSYFLGLMSWKDIDIQVLNPDIGANKFWSFCKLISEQPGFVDLTIQDTSDTKTDLVAGKYIGIHFSTNKDKDPWDLVRNKKETWKIDIWFTKPSFNKTILDNQQMLTKLTPENKLIILEIKDQIAHFPTYRKSIYSVDIYQAVLDNQVTDLESFKEYLQSQNRFL